MNSSGFSLEQVNKILAWMANNNIVCTTISKNGAPVFIKKEEDYTSKQLLGLYFNDNPKEIKNTK